MKAAIFRLFAGLPCALLLPCPAVAKEKVVYSFNFSDGANPVAGLAAVDGTLYGTTYDGGAYNGGTAFTIDESTGAVQVLYSFGRDNDSAYPQAALIDVNGTLYGTTTNGGEGRGIGTVFSLDPSTGAEAVLHAFSGRDGGLPGSSLIEVDGLLYGTTEIDGGQNGGTLFSLDPGTGALQVLHAFSNGKDGAEPRAGLINVKGTLYGTTWSGGGHAGGAVFSLDLSTGAEAVVYGFCSQQNCTDGEHPEAGVVRMNGALYGTTYEGGANGYGTIFTIDPKTGAETVLHAFAGADGSYPQSGLINVKGILYGTTSEGGGTSCRAGAGCGTVFSFDPNTGTETVLHSFCATDGYCIDGVYPVGGLVHANGRLYGTTEYGGTDGYGTVFSIKTP